MREYIRHPSTIPLEVRAADLPERRTELLNNVSVGGLSFTSRLRFDPGARIIIKIPLLGDFVQVTGQVVWCQEESGAFEVGAVFLDKQEAFLIRMVEQICHIEQYKDQVWQTEHRQLTIEQAAEEWIRKYADTFPPLIEEHSN